VTDDHARHLSAQLVECASGDADALFNVLDRFHNSPDDWSNGVLE